MKTIFFSALLLSGAVAVHAQASSGGGRQEKNETVAESRSRSDFSGMEMNLYKRRLVFDDMPESTGGVTIQISDSNGNLVKETKITAADNVVDIKDLDNGTYFIKVLYHDESQKGFVLNL